MALKVYGIKNCNTMAKAIGFLQEKGAEFEFFDYKKQKPTETLLKGFLNKTNLPTLVNKQGTTYRKMTEEQKAELEKEESAIPILTENSSMIKRPVIVYPDGSITLGFDPKEIEARLI
jgi:Spx/MgsR family transcriptional regulator